MKTFSIVVTIFFCLRAHAELSAGVENASAVVYPPGLKVPSIYYSNINQLDESGENYIGDPQGLHCNTNLNPNCKNKNDIFVLGISSTQPVTGTALYYFVITTTGAPPAIGAPITSGHIFSRQGYSAPKDRTPMVMSFGYLCSRLADIGQPGIDKNCNQSNPSNSSYFTFYLIADANGNGVLDANEEIVPITFIVNSSIPRYASKKDQIGLYSFEVTPENRFVHMLNLMAGGALNFAKAVRFYYTAGPLSGAYEPKFFQGLDPALNPQLNFFESGIEGDGNLLTYRFGPVQNGQRYYFRTAIVDVSGNIGYLTPPVDDSIEHTAVPAAHP